MRMSVAIQAEWRCILNALTIPEYMDVWLKMPGVETGECPPEQKLSESFCMEIFLFGSHAENCLRGVHSQLQSG